MKRMSKILSLLLALCLALSVSAFASAEPSAEPSGETSLAGTYTDGTHTLVINDDLTFTMEKTGLNLEAEEFTMLVTGVFSEDGTFVINGLYDGEINLVEVASADQLAADEATVAAAFAGGKVAEEGLAGTYSDGTHTLVINEDLTFTMEKTGLNLEAEEFTMLVTGVFSEDGTFVIDGLYDGEINLVEVASADQLAADEATVAAAFAGGKVGGASAGAVAPGTYTDGTNTLVIAEDMTFTMEKVGLNLEAEEFTMLVTGTVEADGTFVINGLYDGEINLIEVATADQIAADLASVQAAYQGR